MSPGAHASSDLSDSRGGPADTVPGGNPEDAGHCDPGDRDSQSERLRMVADRSLLGHPISGGSGPSAVGDGQGAHQQQGGHVPDGRRGSSS